MKKTLIYLYDPLCGWCYGITPALSSIARDTGIAIEMLPTGLFSDEQPRVMNDEFAAFAWRNDQRIASLTGQGFSERYRELVLGNRKQSLDSGPATLALTAVYLTEPVRELEALKAIQHARYVDGQDITDLSILGSILKSLDLNAAGEMVESNNPDIVEANDARINRAQELLKIFNARGVPTFIVSSGENCRKLDTSDIYSNPQSLIHQMNEVELTASTS
jgi:putative protein-disulfide isomerase